MNTEDATARRRAANAILGELLELDPADWTTALEARAPEPALRREVEALLAAVRAPDRRLEPPDDPFALLPAPARPAIAQDQLRGRRLGSWELVEEIGRGGMSVVYRARRLGADFEQIGAVKLLGLAALGTGGRARFDRERALLARLRHPQIAGLIDGGMADDGTPFLVMQLVEGERIDRWCEAQGLDLEARLRLLASVCDAVAHAHRQLVLHRDLKPANILVTPGGIPILLDFGIGTLIDPDAEATASTLRAMTPGYAAPEQEAGQPCSTATDVFALGRVLATLLRDTGPLPRDLRVLLEVAQHPDPERRYPDARALADEIGRFLARRPLHAVPDAIGYRLRRFLQRHRAALAVATVLLATLLGGLAATLWQARRAEAEAARALATRDFLVELLRGANRENTGSADPRVSELIDLAAGRMDADARMLPALRVDVGTMLGELYTSVGRHAQAEARLQAALAQARQLGAPALEAGVHVRLGMLANSRNEAAAALAHFEQALALPGIPDQGRGQLYADALPGLAYALHNLGRSENAKARLQAVLADPDPAIGPQQRDAILLGLASLPLPPAERLPPLQRALERAGSGELTPWTELSVQASLAQALGELGRHAEAVGHLQRAIDLAEDIYPGPHSRRVRLYSNIAGLLTRSDRYPEAERFLARAEAMYRELGDDHSPAFSAMLNNLGTLQLELGRAREAIVPLRESLALATQHFGERDPRTRAAQANLLQALAEAGEQDAAADLWLQAQRGWQPDEPPISTARFQAVGAEIALLGGELAAAARRSDASRRALAVGPDGFAAQALELRLRLVDAVLASLQGTPDLADAGFAEALTLASTIGRAAWTREWRIMLAMAGHAERSGDAGRAERHRQAAATLYRDRSGAEPDSRAAPDPVLPAAEAG